MLNPYQPNVPPHKPCHYWQVCTSRSSAQVCRAGPLSGRLPLKEIVAHLDLEYLAIIIHAVLDQWGILYSRTLLVFRATEI